MIGNPKRIKKKNFKRVIHSHRSFFSLIKMAKVGARSIGILAIFLIIYNINICATNPIDESK